MPLHLPVSTQPNIMVVHNHQLEYSRMDEIALHN